MTRPTPSSHFALQRLALAGLLCCLSGLLALAMPIPVLAACNFSVGFEACDLPAELKRATIVYHGQLTPEYRYLEQFI